MRIAVIGSGSWGTAQAHHLRRAGHEVLVWGRDKATLQALTEGHHRFFPHIQLAAGLQVSSDLAEAVRDQELIVMAVPSKAMREVAHALAPAVARDSVVVSTAKGLEPVTYQRMSEVLYQEIGFLERLAVLSGPSFAQELARNLPTAVTVAGYTKRVLEAVKAAYHFDNMRIYTSHDFIGVELGGVFKNVLALATGIVDGFGMGNNARAALLTRGMAEISRLVVALGGQEATMQGLSGVGDAILTSTGDLSRNRQVGLRLGRGETLQEIMTSMEQVAEGVTTTASGVALARACAVEVPIMSETAKVLAGEHSVAQAVGALLARSPRQEHN